MPLELEDTTHVGAPTQVEQPDRCRHKGQSDLTTCIMLCISNNIKHLPRHNDGGRSRFAENRRTIQRSRAREKPRKRKDVAAQMCLPDVEIMGLSC
jgi:hypothetical protein